MIKNTLITTGFTFLALSCFAEVEISNPWSRITAEAQKNGAIFMTIKSDQEDDLIKAEATELAEKIELHAHKIDVKDGIAKMVEVEAIALPQNKEVVLKPKDLHIMLFGLKKPFRLNEKHKITLTFKKAGEKNVEFEIKPLDYQPCHCNH